jgi:hypothetical protein
MYHGETHENQPFTVIVVISAVFSRDYCGLLCTRFNRHHYRAGAAREGLFGIHMMRLLRFPDRWIQLLSGKDPNAVMAAAEPPSERVVDSSSGREPCLDGDADGLA